MLSKNFIRMKKFSVADSTFCIIQTVLVKAPFKDIQALKTRLNGHDDDIDIVDKNFKNFLTVTSKEFSKE